MAVQGGHFQTPRYLRQAQAADPDRGLGLAAEFSGDRYLRGSGLHLHSAEGCGGGDLRYVDRKCGGQCRVATTGGREASPFDHRWPAGGEEVADYFDAQPEKEALQSCSGRLQSAAIGIELKYIYQ